MGLGPARKSYRYRNNRQSNRWRQIGISACALLIPPAAIVATAYAMLQPRPAVVSGTAPNSVISLAQAHAATAPIGASPEARFAAPEPAMSGQGIPQPAAQPAMEHKQAGSLSAKKIVEPYRAPGAVDSSSASTQPAPPMPTESTSAAPAVPTGGTESDALASAGYEPTQKDMTRVPMGPVPVRVTVVTAPNGARTAEAPAESSTLATALAAEARGLRSARSHFRSYIRHLAHHGTARSEARAARWRAKSHEFSLHGFLQQLGSSREREAQRADATGGHTPSR